MPKLAIDTRASLFEPIEIEIDGEKFQVKPLTRDLLRKIQDLDEKILGGNADAPYERLEALIGTSPIIDGLTLQQVIEITMFIVNSARTPKKTEKNLPGPAVDS